MDRNTPDANTSMFAENWRSCDWIATVSGMDFELVKIRATSMSFHTHRNWKIAGDAMAGSPSGRTICPKVRHSLAPSMRADSRSSRGTCRKKLRSRNIANGSPRATWKRITPKTVPKIPRTANSRAKGIRATCTGTAMRAMMGISPQSRPGKSMNAKA